jgi:hypothetical protein
MANRDTNVIVNELPLRSRYLSIDDVQDIFGGCLAHSQPCSKDSDCCPAPNIITNNSTLNSTYTGNAVCSKSVNGNLSCRYSYTL